MSNNCIPTGTIKMTNYCYQQNPPEQVIENYCNYTYSGAQPQLAAACLTASSAGEWVPAGAGDVGCYFDPSRPGQGVVAGSCNAINGSYGKCSRSFYSGDPFICCLNSVDCEDYRGITGMPSLCYSDPGMNNTCDPKYRQLTNTNCQGVMYAYCSGQTGTQAQWFENWLRPENGCVDAITRNVFRNIENGCPGKIPIVSNYPCGSNTIIDYDAQGYYWAQGLMTEAFNYYKNLGYVIGSTPGDVGYNPWQDVVYDKICCSFPGLCQDGLANACANKTPLNLSINPRAIQFCGCHLPPVQYLDYTSKFNVSPQCTPLCNRLDTVPITDINGQYLPCQQNICIMDDTTVNLINSTIGGGLDFTQLCGNCPTGACSCIATNNTIDIINSNIGGNVTPVLQNCGSFSRQQTNPSVVGPNTIPVPAGTTGVYNPFLAYQQNLLTTRQQQKKTSWLWTVLIMIVLLVSIFLLIWYLSKRPVEQPKPTLPPIPRLVYPDTSYRDPPRTLHLKKVNFF